MSPSIEPQRTGAPRNDLAESVDGHVHTSPPGRKICCVCGADVAGKKRYKDSTGTYWCGDCGDPANERRPHEAAVATPSTAPCAECGHEFPKEHLADHDGKLMCSPCGVKVQQRHKREQARLAAVAEEERRMEARHKQIMYAAIAFVVLVVLYVLYTFVF